MVIETSSTHASSSPSILNNSLAYALPLCTTLSPRGTHPHLSAPTPSPLLQHASKLRQSSLILVLIFRRHQPKHLRLLLLPPLLLILLPLSLLLPLLILALSLAPFLPILFPSLFFRLPSLFPCLYPISLLTLLVLPIHLFSFALSLPCLPALVSNPFPGSFEGGKGGFPGSYHTL
ncbi:unnamed protein product [Closterium sp. NIES-54]